MTMKISIFRDITPFSRLEVNRRFGGRNQLHQQDLNQGRDQLNLSFAFTLVSCLLCSSALKMEMLTFKKLHGFISQKTYPFSKMLMSPASIDYTVPHPI
jgi:hypothetical protein